MSVTTEVTLEDLREEIDRIDRSLLELIAERYRTVEEVGRLKESARMMPLDPAREAGIVRRAAGKARALGLPEEGVREVFWSLLALCRRAIPAARGAADGCAPARTAGAS